VKKVKGRSKRFRPPDDNSSQLATVIVTRL